MRGLIVEAVEARPAELPADWCDTLCDGQDPLLFKAEWGDVVQVLSLPDRPRGWPR